MVFCNLSGTLKKISLIFGCVLIFNGNLFAATFQEQSRDTALARLLADSIMQDVLDDDEEALDTTTTTSTIVDYIPLPVVIRSVPDSTINALKLKKEFEYANDSAYWKRENISENISRPIGGKVSLLTTIFYWLLIGAVVYFFYRLIVANKLYLFYSSSKKTKANSEETDITNENLEEKISEYITAQQYRQAVRYMYLKSLRLLDKKGWIRFNARSTNIDYVNAMSKRPDGEAFRVITRHYEYVWYGEFELNSMHFDYLHKKFEDFYIRLK